MGTKFSNIFRCIGAIGLLVVALSLSSQPVSAQDNVQSPCNGTGGTTCTVFQLDGSAQPVANANTCVGTENGCPNNENPVWPSDWDALLYPSLTSGSVSVISGKAPGAYAFTLPWTNGFGSFSGVITSTLVSTGPSTILKQGSKNGSDISTWVVASQSSPPKDAYVAGALATYVGPPNTSYSGHELLYAGSTRFAPNGSASIGIWFFQQNVAVCSSGQNAGKAMCVSGSTTLATHQNKDLFLFLTFSGGGKATIQAAEWQGTGTSGSLGNATSLTTCPAAGSQGCAVSNAQSSITLGGPTGPQAPGTGFNVSGPGFPGFPNGVVPALQFQETGIDLNSIFNGTSPCFSSVMFASVTSGSSPATASMKSILLGSFNTCAISVTKECKTGTANANGTITYPIDGQVENVGGGGTSGLSLTDTFNSTSQAFDSGSLSCSCGPSGCTVTGTDCSTVALNPGGTVSYSANITTSQNGGSDVVHATMGGSGGGSASGDSNPATCNALSFSTGITISKSCTTGATLVPVGTPATALEVQVGVGGTVTNNSTGNLSLTSLKVYDCVGASFSGTPPNIDTASCAANGGKLRGPFSLSDLGASGSATDHESWSDTYLPSVVPACGTNYGFSDQALVTAACTSNFCSNTTVQNISQVATCPLCPGPSCPANPNQ